MGCAGVRGNAAGGRTPARAYSSAAAFLAAGFLAGAFAAALSDFVSGFVSALVGAGLWVAVFGAGLVRPFPGFASGIPGVTSDV